MNDITVLILIFFIIGLIFYLYTSSNRVKNNKIPLVFTPPVSTYKSEYQIAVEWAIKVKQEPDNYIIADTETTGLGNKDVVISMAIIDMNGNVLFDEKFRPSKKKSIPTEASMIHGIKMKDLYGKPEFGEMWLKIKDICKYKKVIFYNAEFDVRMIQQTLEQDEINERIPFKSVCAMVYYSNYKNIGRDYRKYLKLPSAKHNAVDDCKAVIKIINEMAGT